MSYSEEINQKFYHFTEEEEDFIDSILTDLGYKWKRATVCGDCCGMYADEYWVDGIGGNFKKADKQIVFAALKKKGITCSIGRYTISADPDDEDEFQIKTEEL